MNIKIIKIFLYLIFLYPILILPQNQSNIDQINDLFDRVAQLDSRNEYKAVLRTLIEIIKIDPQNLKAQHQLGAAFRGYYSKISDDEELLSEVTMNIKDISKIPVVRLLAYYYSSNNVNKVHELLERIVSVDTSKLHLSPEPLFEVNQENNRELFRELLNIIQPHVANEKQSEFVFLNYLFDPTKRLTSLLNELNIRIDLLKLCNDSLESKRIRELYFTKNPNPRTALFDQIMINLSDCLTLQNPVLLSIYYYRNGFYDELNKIMVNNLSIARNLLVDYRDLLYIDKNLNPAEAKKLLKILIKHLPPDINYGSFSDVELFKLGLIFLFVDNDKKANVLFMFTDVHKLNLFTLYAKKDTSELDYLLAKKKISSEYLEIDKEEIENFDISIDTLRARKVFSFILNNVEQNEFKNYKIDFLYELLKSCRLLNIDYDKIAFELVRRINTSEYNYIKMVIWAISCILTNDENFAEQMFISIKNFGADSEKEYLAKELQWWTQTGLNSQVIINFLSKLNYTTKNVDNISSTTESDTTSIESATGENYYALLIGVESYKDKEMNLQFPLKDLKKLKDVLLNQYLFAEKNIITLENPQRNEIFKIFQFLKKKITLKDNILIFYAGHGYYDENMDQGFWYPSDATRDDRTNWISNSEIVSLVKSVTAKHTLLIADACFSGSIFLTRKPFYNYDKSINVAYSLRSRKGMTSGANTPVPDKSVFVEYFIKKLKQNTKKYLLAETLYLDFRGPVTNNSATVQTPLYGELDGDEGGEFIFIQK